VSGPAISSVAASFSSPNVHTVDIKEPAQPLQAGFWASLASYHNFEL